MQSDLDAQFIKTCIAELDACKAGENCAERVFDKVVGAPGEGTELKRGVISALLEERDNETLGFIVRSLLLQLISGALFLVALAILGTLTLVTAIIVGAIIYGSSLALSRLLNKQLYGATKFIIRYLNSHERLKNAILNNF